MHERVSWKKKIIYIFLAKWRLLIKLSHFFGLCILDSSFLYWPLLCVGYLISIAYCPFFHLNMKHSFLMSCFRCLTAPSKNIMFSIFTIHQGPIPSRQTSWDYRHDSDTTPIYSCWFMSKIDAPAMFYDDGSRKTSQRSGESHHVKICLWRFLTR